MAADPFLDPTPSSGHHTPRRPQRLPPEVWGRVARYLADGPTLLALRAVCSDCTAEVTPLALRVICVHDTPASVQRLERLRTGGDMEHLFRHVRQARILYRAERPPAPPKRRSRLGQSFARLLHRREELAPAPDLGRETYAAACTERLWAAFDSHAWRALVQVGVVFAHVPAEAIDAFISRAVFQPHGFDVRLSDAAAPAYGLFSPALRCWEEVARPHVRVDAAWDDGENGPAGMPAWLGEWQAVSGAAMALQVQAG